MKTIRKIFVLLMTLLSISIGYCQDIIPQIKQLKEPSKAITGFLDPNIYYDTRGSYDFTLNALAILPHRFQYFTFTNHKNIGFDGKEASSYYSEHHLYWGITKKAPFDLSLQWMTVSGEKNDALRFGFRWRVGNTGKIEHFFKKIGLTYNVAFHLYQIDNQQNRSPWFTQIEHFYRLNLFKKRIYISGFADQDVYYKGNKLFTFVTEHQLGVRIIDNLYLVAEYRFNDYLPVNKSGLGLGLEYFIGF